ncbi:hypothetical protein M0P65_01765 [Candidatus Gracilibacteria bacterium]|nr:hypothetical protein [Candidatus Gracilibacteria bacterium]
MTNFRKVVAGASAIAILTMNMINFTANAAAINNATAVVTPATDVVVTSAGSFAGATTCTATIVMTNAGGANSNVALTGPCTVTDNNTLTLPSTNVAANQYYTITFSADNGTFGSATAGDTTNNVVVSARVLPILSMAISNSTVDLGVLSALAPTDSTTDTTVTVATNANGGYVVSAAASNFVGATTGNVIPFRTRAAQLAGTEGFSIDVASVGQGANGTSTIAATAGLDVASTYAISGVASSIAAANGGVGTPGTTDGDTFVANYEANISPVTEADNYSTTVTYTVSGTF